MFASLILQLPTPVPSIDAGGDPRAHSSSPSTIRLEAQLPFSEILKLPPAFPVSANHGSGELLPEDGNGLPLVTLPAQPALPEVNLLAPADLNAAVDLDVDLIIDYPTQDPQTDSLPQVALLPITPVRNLLERQEWVAGRVEAGPVIANSVQGLRNQSDRPTAEVPTVTFSDADGATATQEIPAVTRLTRAIAAFETLRQPDTRVARGNASAASTPVHLAATLSQFAGESPVSRSDTLAAQIGTPVRDAAWGEKLGERVMLLTGNQIKSADIRLTPADLGPLRIQLRIDDGIASVTFHAQHAVTRDAIEQALPRLREMMAESGLSLGQTDVSERGVSGGDAEQDGSQSSDARANADDTADHPVLIELPQRRKTVSIDGLVDTFA